GTSRGEAPKTPHPLLRPLRMAPALLPLSGRARRALPAPRASSPAPARSIASSAGSAPTAPASTRPRFWPSSPAATWNHSPFASKPASLSKLLRRFKSGAEQSGREIHHREPVIVVTDEGIPSET